jgi:hypothetical protein
MFARMNHRAGLRLFARALLSAARRLLRGANPGPMCREITKRPFQNLKVEWVEIASKFGHFKVPTEGPLRVDSGLNRRESK